MSQILCIPHSPPLSLCDHLFIGILTMCMLLQYNIFLNGPAV